MNKSTARARAFAPFFIGAFCALALAFSIGCQNPVHEVDELEKKADTSDRTLVTEAQKEIAGTKAALDAAPKSRPVDVAKESAARADALLAQANGSLPAAELAKRLALVQGQLSEVKAERAAAELNLAVERENAAELSKENTAIKGELTAARDTLKTWAVERDETAKKWERMWFWIWCAASLYGASIVLPIVASVFTGGAAGPVLGLASKLVGFVAAPAIQFAKERAVGGLERVGHALEDFRQDAPQFAAKITRKFDAYTDADHQRVIGSAARKYKSEMPPPPSVAA